MPPEHFNKYVLIGLISGVIVALICCILFGILDVQCFNSDKGPHWNARTASCQFQEVTK